MPEDTALADGETPAAGMEQPAAGGPREVCPCSNAAHPEDRTACVTCSRLLAGWVIRSLSGAPTPA